MAKKPEELPSIDEDLALPPCRQCRRSGVLIFPR